MKSSILFTALTTLALSLGSASATSSPSLEKRGTTDYENEQNTNYNDNIGLPQYPMDYYEDLGIRQRALDCKGRYFTKLEAYNVVYYAQSAKVKGKWFKYCFRMKCVQFPARYNHADKPFELRETEGLQYFPILPYGKLYEKDHPGYYYVVYNQFNAVVSIYYDGPFGKSKCLYNDQIRAQPIIPPSSYLGRVKNGFSYVGQRVGRVFGHTKSGEMVSARSSGGQSYQKIDLPRPNSPRLTSPRLTSPRLTSPRPNSPRLTSPRLDSSNLDHKSYYSSNFEKEIEPQILTQDKVKTKNETPNMITDEDDPFTSKVKPNSGFSSESLI